MSTTFLLEEKKKKSYGVLFCFFLCSQSLLTFTVARARLEMQCVLDARLGFLPLGTHGGIGSITAPACKLPMLPAPRNCGLQLMRFDSAANTCTPASKTPDGEASEFQENFSSNSCEPQTHVWWHHLLTPTLCLGVFHKLPIVSPYILLPFLK